MLGKTNNRYPVNMPGRLTRIATKGNPAHGARLLPWQTYIITLVLCLYSASGIAQPQPDANTYRLSPSDAFRVYVVGEPDLSLELTVNDEGAVYYPLLGRIEVAGMTDGELESLLTERLTGDYLVNPDISVNITGYRKFFMEGQVRSPGAYQYAPGLTVRQAVALAGGFTEMAARNRIYLFSEAQGDKEKKKVSPGDPVSPGDVIEVDESFF